MGIEPTILAHKASYSPEYITPTQKYHELIIIRTIYRIKTSPVYVSTILNSSVVLKEYTY